VSRGGAVGRHTEDRKTIRHPDIGDITVDCDVLSDSDTDLKIVIYTAVITGGGACYAAQRTQPDPGPWS
jgi:hypothetical protein